MSRDSYPGLDEWIYGDSGASQLDGDPRDWPGGDTLGSLRTDWTPALRGLANLFQLRGAGGQSIASEVVAWNRGRLHAEDTEATRAADRALLRAAGGRLRYRDTYTLTYDAKPVPSKAHDFDWLHDEYDGPGDERCGSCASIYAALVVIEEQREEA